VKSEDRAEPGELGDMAPAEFRKQLHAFADWIADYRENLAARRISPDAKPGTVMAALPSAPPETGEPIERIFADVEWKRVNEHRTHWPFLRDRRIDAYSGIEQRLLD